MYVNRVSLRLRLTGSSRPTSLSVPLFPWDRHTFRHYCVIGTLRSEGLFHMLISCSPRNSRVVYIPTQLINFAVIPPHLRFVFVGVVSLFWSAFLPRSPFPSRRTLSFSPSFRQTHT